MQAKPGAFGQAVHAESSASEYAASATIIVACQTNQPGTGRMKIYEAKITNCKTTDLLPGERHCLPIIGNNLTFRVLPYTWELWIDGAKFYNQQLEGDFHEMDNGDFHFNSWTKHDACAHIVSAHKTGNMIGFSNTVVQTDGAGDVIYRRSVIAKIIDTGSTK